LLFWDPDVRRYFRVPYRNASRPAISLWELRAAVRHLQQKGKSEIDEDALFRAIDEMRRIEDEARTLTRKQRMERERRSRHREVKPHIAPKQPVPEPTSATNVAERSKPSSVPGRARNFAHVKPFDEIEDV
jgi:putative transposase